MLPKLAMSTIVTFKGLYRCLSVRQHDDFVFQDSTITITITTVRIPGS